MLRRIRAVCATLACVTLAAGTTAPVAGAAARDLLAQAIANTRGSYLVYNFGDGFPAPMLNAAGDWYELNSGGHLMIVKSASQRLSPRLLVDTHQGFQARCERTPGARTHEGLMQASETDDRDQRQLFRRPLPTGRLLENHRVQLSAGRLCRQHRGVGQDQPRRHRHPGVGR